MSTPGMKTVVSCIAMACGAEAVRAPAKAAAAQVLFPFISLSLMIIRVAGSRFVAVSNALLLRRPAVRLPRST
jgi:hypothetical protein